MSPPFIASNGLGGSLSQAAVERSANGTSDLSVPAQGCGDRQSKRGVEYGHHLCSTSEGVCLSGGDHGLVLSVCVGLGTVSQFRRQFLCERVGQGFAARSAGHLQFGSRFTVHERSLYR